MQKYFKTISALAASAVLGTGSASAEVEYTIAGGVHNAYMFRGTDLGDGLVDLIISATTEIAGFELKAGIYHASWDAKSLIPGEDIPSEQLDLFFEVSRNLGFLTTAFGYTYYQFQDGDPASVFNTLEDTQEIYFSFSRKLFGINTALTYVWEIEDAFNAKGGNGTGGYLEVSGSKSFELSPSVSLVTDGVLGYLVEDGALTHTQLKIGIDWAFTETATLSPYIAHTWALGEDSNWSFSGNELFGGAVLSVRF